jgi:AcrR family transcriptional regulator
VTTSKTAYHHGDLRRTLLEAATDVIAESGVAALSLRDLSRNAGVSHAAPTHHFGDKAGLLTALAVDELEPAQSFLDAGVAYVRFAVDNPAHFDVMFRPDLYNAEDPDLVAARERSGAALYRGASLSADEDVVRVTGLAGWSIAHGFATLWLSGAMPDFGGEPEDAAREILERLRA